MVLCGRNSVVECLLAMQNVAGSNPAVRSRNWYIGRALGFQPKETVSITVFRSKRMQIV
jgi:hypothetical protein